MNQTIDERFWSKVNKLPGDDACWEWVACCNDFGYGQFWADVRVAPAHRISWTMRNGPVPDGLHVLHKCDNPRCVNPNHLFLGTNIDNVHDRHTKGRDGHGEVRGETHGMVKLTEARVRELRSRYGDGRPATRRALGVEFGISQTTVYRIATRRLWKHVA